MQKCNFSAKIAKMQKLLTRKVAEQLQFFEKLVDRVSNRSHRQLEVIGVYKMVMSNLPMGGRRICIVLFYIEAIKTLFLCPFYWFLL